MSQFRLYILCILFVGTACAIRAQLPDVGNPAEAMTGVSDTTHGAEPAEADTIVASGLFPTAMHELTAEELREWLGLPDIPGMAGAAVRPLKLFMALGSGWPGTDPLRATDAHTPLWWLRLLLLPAMAAGAWLTARRRKGPPPVGETWAEAMERHSRRRDLQWAWGITAGGIFLAHGGAVVAGGILLLLALLRHLRAARGPLASGRTSPDSDLTNL